MSANLIPIKLSTALLKGEFGSSNVVVSISSVFVITSAIPSIKLLTAFSSKLNLFKAVVAPAL